MGNDVAALQIDCDVGFSAGAKHKHAVGLFDEALMEKVQVVCPGSERVCLGGQ